MLKKYIRKHLLFITVPHAISSFSQREGLNENPFAQRSGVKDCSESPTHRDTPK